MPTLRRIFKWLLWTAAGLLAVVLAAAAYLAWPRSYARNYLQDGSTAATARGLARVANEKRTQPFHVGTIGDPARLQELDEFLPGDFNSVTAENAMKWEPLLDHHRLGPGGPLCYDFAAADRFVDHCLQRGVRVRGHNLVWGRFLSDAFVADVEARLKASPDPKAAMRQLLREHLTAVMGHFRGRVREWDVLNEPLAIFKPELDNTIWHRTLGDGYIAEIFQMAREADPEAKLFLNEQLESYGDARAEKLLALLAELVRNKVPLDGLGIESHVTVKAPDLKELQRFLERVTQLGLKFELTEIDVRLRIFSSAPDPYAAQAEYMGELVRTAAAFKECRGVTFWGLSDKHSWMDGFPPFKFMKPNEPLLLDENYRRKPAYWAVERALAR